MNNSTSKLFKQTVSLCPECYKRIPALIYIDENVMMKKNCTEHGDFVSMVERDPTFYLQCARSDAQTIYAGYFIDVTEKCNLACKYCYYPVNNKKKDRPIENILQDAVLHQSMAPFILTGGEPTLRQDLPDIISSLKNIGPVELLTNGTGLNKDLMEKILPMLRMGDTAAINMSIHPEIEKDNYRVFELCREFGVKLESVLFVIDSLDDIYEVINTCAIYKDVICATRIKAATRVWNEQKPENKIFVSDMVNFLCDPNTFDAQPVWWRKNKVSFFNTELNGIMHMLVSWYDRFNIDMMDIDCAPYYQPKTGETTNILTAMLINEGLQKGWLNGNRIEVTKWE